ncbi:MAG: topoisomerase DNA-binding C4 zinc finger domain-containing protein, partial [Candidatus Parvarchaeota archaeon]|nr:topoisomerase DNA-binding C4 zinc finger domain-containing protein [Candidatus Parvarchaeota archaeon]
IAFAVTENLKKISPELTGAGLTAHIEDEMKKVELGEKSKKEVVDETREIVDKMLSDLMKKKSEIKELMHEALLKQYIFGKCPKSGGDLRMIISKKTHKRFVGCGDYPKCHFGMPLPQSGYMFISPQICPKCGIHMIEWKSKDKPRTYVFCVNPACKVEKKAVAETKKPAKRNQSEA